MATNLATSIPITSTVNTKEHPTHEPTSRDSISLRDAEHWTLNIRMITACFDVAFALRIDYSIGVPTPPPGCRTPPSVVLPLEFVASPSTRVRKLITACVWAVTGRAHAAGLAPAVW
jgi:hypothetical protein